MLEIFPSKDLVAITITFVAVPVASHNPSADEDIMRAAASTERPSETVNVELMPLFIGTRLGMERIVLVPVSFPIQRVQATPRAEVMGFLAVRKDNVRSHERASVAERGMAHDLRQVTELVFRVQGKGIGPDGASGVKLSATLPVNL